MVFMSDMKAAHYTFSRYPAFWVICWGQAWDSIGRAVACVGCADREIGESIEEDYWDLCDECREEQADQFRMEVCDER